MDLFRRMMVDKLTRILILKGRQQGFSTFILGWFLLECISKENVNAVVISHESKATERLFSRVQYMINRMEVKPMIEYSSKSGITFPYRNSSFYIGTAGSKAFGRGDTITHLHCSEAAFWPNFDLLWTGLNEAIVPGGYVIMETTPNGIANSFYNMWQAAKDPYDDFTGLFYPWYFYQENIMDKPVEGELFSHELELIEKAKQLGFTINANQLAWRRHKLKIGPEKPIPAESILLKFLQEHPEDDITCFIQSGRPVFEAKHCVLGCEEEPPAPGEEYVIAGDVAEGIEGGDFDAAYVIHKQTGKQVAAIHGLWKPAKFGEILYALGERYNWALLAPERNNHGHVVIQKLEEMGYPELYTHEDGKYGWLTTSKNKPIIIDNLEEALRERHLLVSDKGFLDECLTFQYNDKGSAEAQTGKHDDRVMAMAIAWAIRSQPTARAYISKPMGF